MRQTQQHSSLVSGKRACLVHSGVYAIFAVACLQVRRAETPQAAKTLAGACTKSNLKVYLDSTSKHFWEQSCHLKSERFLYIWHIARHKTPLTLQSHAPVNYSEARQSGHATLTPQQVYQVCLLVYKIRPKMYC